jgi:hypothetical protein
MRKKQLIQEEERERGNVSLQVYWSYMTAAYKGALIPLIISSQALFQALQIGSNWWMAWANPQTDGEASRTSSLVLILVYMGLAFGSTIFVFTRALLVATFGLKASQKLFSNMLQSWSEFSVPLLLDAIDKDSMRWVRERLHSLLHSISRVSSLSCK